MSFFSSKPKDGPGFVRIRYCGNVKTPGGVTSGFASRIFTNQDNAASAKQYLTKLLNSNTLKDDAGKLIARSTNYQIGQYTGYSESKSQPGKFYHDFIIVNPEDSFCHSGGIRRTKKRVTRRRKSKRSSNKRRTRR